ncbi:protein MKS1 [Brachypodium distachyon]|uniref:VQ domain-containing protein n=1 Tax=Brachypodium distachyon TaxID=15368 RepID=I1GXJ2_BRADI|nr:protein MKS1 [Brachypodium distachyon]KQK17769.1 hypothetical protein BRADI_1g36630v3 [Brachypodium distachyon]|eukprot:XP_003563665.1 protein MKS1 [Brachypodium distachyon]
MAAASYDADHVRRHSGLGVHAASRKIGKPAPSAPSTSQNRKPVIIYMVSPKVIHVEAHEFMSLVQRLTGPDGGDDQARLQQASTSSSSPRAAAARKQGAPPVRVKARALNRPGPAVSVSVTATRQQQQQQQAGPPSSWAVPSPASGFLFRDLSPLRGGALKGEGASSLVSPWLHHVSGGDHFLSPGAPGLASPSGFLDIFGPLSSSQHQ